jgi:hypothetical protein
MKWKTELQQTLGLIEWIFQLKWQQQLMGLLGAAGSRSWCGNTNKVGYEMENSSNLSVGFGWEMGISWLIYYRWSKETKDYTQAQVKQDLQRKWANGLQMVLKTSIWKMWIFQEPFFWSDWVESQIGFLLDWGYGWHPGGAEGLFQSGTWCYEVRTCCGDDLGWWRQ